MKTLRPNDRGRQRGVSRRKLLRAAGGGAVALSALAACDVLSTRPARDEEIGRTTDLNEREAPALAARVKAGELPPLAERLPPEPLVVEPRNRPGRYGGTLRATAIGPNAASDPQLTMKQGLFTFSHDLAERTPNVAESFEMAPDFTACVIQLRKGIKWSDGEPFNADDVLFYFEDYQFDEELYPITSPDWIRGGERVKVRKLDEYAVEFTFAVPSPAFYLLHQSAPPIDPYLPRHFMEQFHPKYNPDAAKQADEAGFENWQDQFSYYVAAHWSEQAPERPDIGPWIPTEITQQGRRFVRNPYFWKVDPHGRQLPYIDEVRVDYVEDLDVQNLRAQAGDVDIFGWGVLLPNYPLLKESERAGNYRAALMKGEEGSMVAIGLNQLHKEPQVRAIFADRRFRQALSVAVDRDEINQVAYLRQGVPRQATITSDATFFKPEWADSYAQHDPDLANQLLDEVGLNHRDGEGMRLRPDGEPFRFRIEFPLEEGPKDVVVELLVRHWRAVGIDVDFTIRDKSYLAARTESGDFDAIAWHVNRCLERVAYLFAPTISKLRPGGGDILTYAKGWHTWFDTDGEDGEEPTEEAKELQAAMEDWHLYDMGTEEYAAAANKVHDLIAEQLWIIGTVGEGPMPVMVSNNLDNVLDEAVFTGDRRPYFGAGNWFWQPQRAEQWFFTA